MAEPDGTGARQVTSDGVDAENPTMSADAAWIVYSSANPSAQGIWKIHPDGSGAACVLHGNFTIPDLAPATGWVATIDSSSQAGRPNRHVRVVRLDDGSTVAEVVVPGEVGNTGRSRWMPDGRTLVSWGARTPLEGTLFRQPVVPGRDTSAQQEVIAVSDERRVIESFGVSPVDGRIVVSAGWGESDVMLAEGIEGLGGKR